MRIFKITNRVVIVLITGAIIAFALPCFASMHRLGNFGATYDIAEPDALAELKARAAKVNWNKIISEEKMEQLARNYHPDLSPLPRAQQHRVRLVDMTYTLPFDIPDGKGGVLYPKGYTFNPLDYIKYPKTIVVIDGTDPEQVAWLADSKYCGSLNTVILLSAGSYDEVSRQLDRPVYYADAYMVERFDLRAVPSVIRQKGRYMEVTEIAVNQKKTDKR